ncbi:MAG: hypothetical protein Q9222_003802 [Ikaeria aurantiellina]
MASYNNLAVLMGEHQELATFRRFQRLNMKNLLYMQAEILHLEQELQNIEHEDSESKDTTRADLQASVFNLKETAETSDHAQWEKVLEIRKKLQDYNQALALASQLEALPGPCRRDFRTLQEWLDRPEGGDFFLRGREAETWTCNDSFVTISHCEANKDRMTGFINDCAIPFYHRLWTRWTKDTKRKECNGIWKYRADTVTTAVNTMTTILSSLLPSTSIFILYFLNQPVARLAAIMVFTAIFSSTLCLMTRARRIDVFAATTAFAAVQAVFVGGSGLCTA